MKKKTLEEKIRLVGFWTFGGVFWYLVIAFFLKSKYPIYDYDFNRSVAYDVVKDALTLAAAFLAPVAAFVLFADWREQHKAVKNEKISEEILRILNSDLLVFYNLIPIDLRGTDKFKEKNILFHRLVAELVNKANEIQIVDDESLNFKNTILSFEEDLYGLWDSLYRQVHAAQQHESIAEFLDTVSCNKKILLSEMWEQSAEDNQAHFERIQSKLRLLKPLCI